MPDIPDSSWSERDDRNAEIAPDGWPPGLPAQIELIGRMMMGAIKRFWNKINPAYITSGTADNYVVKTESQSTFLNIFEILRVRIHATNTTTTPTLQFGATNARTIVKVSPTGIVPLVAGDLLQGKDHEFWLDGTNFILSNPATVDSASTIGLLKAANNLSDLANAGTARTNIGLGNVDNTSDANKPVSTAQQSALNLKANLSSPSFTGTPTAPTPSGGDNSTKLATTAYVDTPLGQKLSLSGGAMTGAIENAIFAAPGANTKKAHFDLSAVTAGQDRAIIVPDSSALALTAWELISVRTPAAATSIDVTNISAFRLVRITGHLWPSTAGSLFLLSSTNNGTSYDNGASDYNNQLVTGQNTSLAGFSGTASSVAISGGTSVTATIDDGLSFELTLLNFNQAARMKVICKAFFVGSAGNWLDVTGHQRLQSTARNAFRIASSAGTISGYLTVEGIRG